MPNNGIISRQAVIPNEFLVESADPTDLVIINTPTTGNKVQQKAVPVSALGGGSLPFHSFVYNIRLNGLIDASEEIFNDIPTDFATFNLTFITGATTFDPVSIVIDCITENEIDLRKSFISTDFSVITNVNSVIKSSSSITFTVTDAVTLNAGTVLELRIYNLNI